MAKKNAHIGSSFDDLLEEMGDSAEVSVVAITCIVAWNISQKMGKENISKTHMLKRCAITFYSNEFIVVEFGGMFFWVIDC